MAGLVPKQVLEDIRFRCDIADVIDSYITLPRKGNVIKTICPFHKEKTPSFNINRQRQIFHCFGCGAGGDVFKFVMMYEQLDFMGAVRLLAERANITLTFDQGGGPKADRDLLFDIHEKLAARYHRYLLKHPGAKVARDYLERRNLTADVVEAFMIGYAPDAWDTVTTWAQGEHIPVDKVELAGLVVRREDARGPNPYYDRFRARVMFPIRNEQGRIIGFSGRTLEKDPKGAKYVNSPETPLFRKSQVLYALDRARRDIVEKREVIICEGQIDVIRCHQAGFTTAVAAQGTAFTEDHARVLRRYADGVVLVFDSDEAGRNAAIKTSGVFLQAGVAVRVATLPRGEDPDSLILKQGATAFQAALDAAVPALDFQISVLQERDNIATEAGLLRVSKAVLGTISLSPNAVQRDMLVQQASRRLGLSPAALQTELRPMIKPAPEPREPGTPPPQNQKPRDELRLLEHLTATPAVLPLVQELLPAALIADAQCRALFDAVVASAREARGLMDVVAERDDAEGTLASFAAAVLSAPARTGAEQNHVLAVQGLVLAIWRTELQRRRLAIGASQERLQSARDEYHMLTADLKKLQRWETGRDVALLYAQSMPA